jgi:hypothetical protein
MVPMLSLNYSSQGYDGYVGWQWSLGGLPSITRCSRTVQLDGVKGGINYDANDRFCLDGQRLILVTSGGTYGADGTEYRTEIDSFVKIIAHNVSGVTGPGYFDVYTKDGRTIELGNTTDSRALAVGTTTARLWAVDKISDMTTNYLTVTYTNDTTNGQIYPTRVDYTGNTTASLSTYNSVQFTYSTTRVDVTPTYQAGSLIQTTVLLTNIKTYNGTTEINDYQLGYTAGTSTTHSRLTTVKLCDGTDTLCLATTMFTWQGGTGLPTMTGTSNSLAQGTTLSPGDFNGDGLTDVMVLGGASCGISYGTNSASFVASDMVSNYTKWTVSEGVYSGEYVTNQNTCFAIPDTHGARVPSDWNGDGYTDITITQNHAAGSPYQHILYNDEAGNLTETTSFGTALSPFAIADFNGDGRADMLTKASSSSAYEVLVSNGDGTFSGTSGSWPSSSTILVGDFDGDGCSDMLQSGTVWTINYSCQPATSSVSLSAWTGAPRWCSAISTATERRTFSSSIRRPPARCISRPARAWSPPASRCRATGANTRSWSAIGTATARTTSRSSPPAAPACTASAPATRFCCRPAAGSYPPARPSPTPIRWIRPRTPSSRTGIMTAPAISGCSGRRATASTPSPTRPKSSQAWTTASAR